MSESHTSMDKAPDDIKLAVDLIYLLESNEVDVDIALSAIDIVRQDLLRKKQSAEDQQTKDTE